MAALLFLTTYWRWLLIGLLLTMLGLQTLRLEEARGDIAGLKSDAALEQASRQLAARQYEVAISTQRAAAAAKQQENADAFNKVSRERDDARTALAAGHDGLRISLQAFLAGGDSGTGAGTAAGRCDRNQAVAIGNVLLAGDELAQDLAEAAEQRNDEVKLLLEQIDLDRAACAPVVVK